MSMAAASGPAVGSDRSLRRQRIGLVLGFWFAGLGVFALRRLLLLQLHAEMETSHQWVELSEEARLWLWLIPILLCCGALAMQICWLPPWGRVLSWAVSVTCVPAALLIAAVIVAVGPHRLDAVLVNGHQYVLASGGLAFDNELILYEVGDAGLSWRKVGDPFDYPGDDALTGDEHLVVSPDGRWLLFARGGLWQDCFRLFGGRALHVEINPDPAGNNRTLETRLRSARIAALTGLRP
jgi:hypothetical protein